MSRNINSGKIKHSEHIFALKIKTESNGLGLLKTFIVLFLIAIQLALIILSYLFFLTLFRWYTVFSLVVTLITCIHCLSSDYHGQAKATWILFMIVCYSFGFVFFYISDKRILLYRSRKKYKKIYNQTKTLKKQQNLTNIAKDSQINCNYLYNVGNFVAHTNSKTTYFSSGAQFYDSVLEELEKAEKFVFIEFFIISNGVLLNRFLDILKQKVSLGVDVRIIYDDMGSHKTLKRKTKKQIKKAGIKLVSFNRLIPIFNIALNLRDHRKIVVVDGKVAFTGGTNLADEYVNEKRMHGYWKDCGIKIEGSAVDNLSIAFLEQWQFITKEDTNYIDFINKADSFEENGVVVPFVSGPNYPCSIAQNIYANEISNAKEKLYIMTPYFIPDETITNLLVNKAKSGVDVKIIIPDIADKKFVYVVSRNNVEKLMDYGIKVYTMTNSFVHSKVVLTENSAIVGSINMDLRSFNQQFESAVFLDDKKTLEEISNDFASTLTYSQQITKQNQKRNSVFYRILAGLFNLISPFM